MGKTFNLGPLQKALKSEFQKTIKNYVQEGLANKNKEQLVVHAFYVYYSIDHENLHFEVYIADKEKKDLQNESSYTLFAELYSDQLKKQYLKYYERASRFDEDTQEANTTFYNLLMDTLAELDYSKLNCHEDFFFWAMDHDGSFYPTYDKRVPVKARTAYFRYNPEVEDNWKKVELMTPEEESDLWLDFLLACYLNPDSEKSKYLRTGYQQRPTRLFNIHFPSQYGTQALQKIITLLDHHIVEGLNFVQKTGRKNATELMAFNVYKMCNELISGIGYCEEEQVTQKELNHLCKLLQKAHKANEGIGDPIVAAIATQLYYKGDYPEPEYTKKEAYQVLNISAYVEK